MTAPSDRPTLGSAPGVVTILFQSGAEQTHYFDRATLDALLSDWERARAGAIPPLQRYPAGFGDWLLDGCLVIDLTTIGAVHIKDVAATKARRVQERAAQMQAAPTTADQAPPSQS